MAIPKPSPEAFRAVPDGKKLDILAKHFLLTCTDKEVFVLNKSGKMKPCADYYGIKRFWGKAPVEKLLYLYDYLHSLPEKYPLSLTDFYRNAEGYRKMLIVEDNKAKLAELKVEKHDEIGLEDVMNL